MSCPACSSGNLVEFSAEGIVHLSGLKNLDKPAVLVFPKLLVCVSCGLSQFTVPETEMALLAAGHPTSNQLGAAAGR
jgi:hypothetical protein